MSSAIASTRINKELNGVVFFSRFKIQENGGGGMRREAQLAEIFSPLNYTFISSMDFTWTPPRFFKIRNVINGRLKYWKKDLISFLEIADQFSRYWAKRVTNSIELVLIDDPIFFSPLVKKLNSLGIPIVALCQNIESLSKSQINENNQKRLLLQELDILGRCELIITISLEETVFLNNLGYSTSFLPYYPVETIKNQLLDIRETRESSDKNGILIHGTINNLVTRDGMEEVIHFWNKQSVEFDLPLLFVAGYGTEKIQHICKSEKIRFLGALNDNDLNQLMTHIMAGICYQSSGAGALTKISEMLIAGIPVMANVQASRTYINTEGVYPIRSLDDIVGVYGSIQDNKIIPIPEPMSSKILLEKLESMKKT